VEEDKVKNLSKRFFVNKNSTAICITIFDTAAWPTGMELWEHPTNSKMDPFQMTAQRALTNQLTNQTNQQPKS
jgi:hypothetical protein